MSNEITQAAPAEERMPKRNLFMFPLGTIGRDFLYYLFNSNLLTFILFTKNVTPAQFASVSIIIIAARIFDAFNDPIMGGIVENTRTKFGKFKPWMTLGALLTCIVVIAVFSAQLHGWAFIGFLAVMYFLFSITFTMNDISYWGMLPSLTTNEHDRNLLTSFAQICAGMGTGLAGILIPMLCIGANPLGGSAPMAFMIIAIISAVLMFGFQMFTVFGVKEKPLPPIQANKKALTLKDMFKVIFKNDQLLWCALLLLLYQVGTQVVNGGLSMSYIYFEFGYNGTLTMLFAVLSSAASTIFTFLFPWLSKKFGRDKLMYSCAFSMIFGYAASLLCGIFIPHGLVPMHIDLLGLIVVDLDLKFLLLTILGLFTGYGGGIYMIMVINLTNTVEYNEWKTGQRDEGLIFSLRPFTAKMASAIMQFIVMLVYLVVGVTKYTNAISDAENLAAQKVYDDAQKMEVINGVLSEIPDSKKTALLACMCIIPILFTVAAILIYKFKFKLTEETHRRMVLEIAEGRSEYALKLAAAAAEENVTDTLEETAETDGWDEKGSETDGAETAENSFDGTEEE